MKTDREILSAFLVAVNEASYEALRALNKTAPLGPVEAPMSAGTAPTTCDHDWRPLSFGDTVKTCSKCHEDVAL